MQEIGETKATAAMLSRGVNMCEPQDTEIAGLESLADHSSIKNRPSMLVAYNRLEDFDFNQRLTQKFAENIEKIKLKYAKAKENHKNFQGQIEPQI